MATGIQAVMSGVATLSYTPTTDAKVRAYVNGSAASTVTINGVGGLFTNSVLSTMDTFVAAGQTYNLTTAVNSTAIVSSIEE